MYSSSPSPFSIGLCAGVSIFSTSLLLSTISISVSILCPNNPWSCQLSLSGAKFPWPILNVGAAVPSGCGLHFTPNSWVKENRSQYSFFSDLLFFLPFWNPPGYGLWVVCGLCLFGFRWNYLSWVGGSLCWGAGHCLIETVPWCLLSSVICS